MNVQFALRILERKAMLASHSVLKISKMRYNMYMWLFSFVMKSERKNGYERKNEDNLRLRKRNLPQLSFCTNTS